MKQITKKIFNRAVLGGFFLPAMLAAAFTGCSQDDSKAADATGQGEARVTLSVGGIAEGTSESMEKAAAQTQTVVVPADNSGMLMECTLEPTAASKTRTTTPMTTGRKYRFAVLNNATNAVVAENVFTSGTAGYLMGLTGSTLYKYVAVSYNSTTDPGTLGAVGSAPASINNIAPSTDLLYASGTFTTAASGSVAVPITFSHKFSQVIAKASASYNNWQIGVGSTIAATLATGYTANLATASGTLSSTGTTATQSFDFSTATADTLVSSAARPVYVAGASSVTLNFSKITINGTAYTNKSVTFPQALAGGSSYTLKIKFRTAIFAGCNVYWDGGKLTFDAAGTTTHQNYMGVVFKWGSLVGVSPARTYDNSAYTINFITGTSGNASTGTPLYVPTYNSTTPGSSSWAKTNAATKSWTWAALPYVDTDPGTYGRTTGYLNNAACNTAAMWNTYKGDICKYLGAIGAAPAGYRLPRAEELAQSDYASWSSGVPGWTLAGSSSTWPTDDTVQDSYPDGKYNGSTNGGIFKTGAKFPSATQRVTIDVPSSGALTVTGGGGWYWTSSASTSTSALFLDVNSGGVGIEGDNIYTNKTRTYGFPVRCVKN